MLYGRCTALHDNTHAYVCVNVVLTDRQHHPIAAPGGQFRPGSAWLQKRDWTTSSTRLHPVGFTYVVICVNVCALNHMLSIAAPVSEVMEIPFGNVSLSGDNIEPNWESEALEMAPVSGTVQFRWKDQGSGNRKGRLHLRLMAPGAREETSFPLTEDFAPHHWDNVTVELEARDPVLALAKVGCWYRIAAEVGDGGGHELHVEDFVLRLAGKAHTIVSYGVGSQANKGTYL